MTKKTKIKGKSKYTFLDVVVRPKSLIAFRFDVEFILISKPLLEVIV